MQTTRNFVLRQQVLTWLLLVFAALTVLLGNLLNNQFARIQELYLQEQSRTTLLMENILNLETGSRGHVITGKPESLEPFELGKVQLPTLFTEVRGLMLRGPAELQERRLELLENIRDVQLDWMGYAERLQQIRKTDFAEAQRIVSTNVGKRRTDQIRKLMGELRQVQQGLIASARTDSQLSLLVTQVLTVVALLLAAVLVLLQGLRMAGRLSSVFQSMVAGSRALAEGKLDHQLDTHSPLIEVQQMGENFNRMVQQLTQSQGELTRQNQSLERLNHQITRLSDLSDQLQTCLTLREAYYLLTFLLPDFLPGTSGEVMLLNASRNQLSRFAVWGEDPLIEHHPTLPPSDCFSLRLGHPYEVHPERKMMPCPLMGDAANYLCIPMLAQGDTIGIFRVKAPQHTEDQAQLAQTLAKQLALALANLQLREALRNQSIRDGLTHVYNRRYFEEALQQEMDRSVRHGHPLGVLMLDVDHFKRYNDSFGHEAGDAVLRAFGNLLQRTCRSSDVVCRYGGEEFVVLLPETHLEGAVSVAENIRQATEKLLPTTREGTRLEGVTVSIGAASTETGYPSQQALLAAADQALYASKKAGRNRVTAATGEAAL